MGWLPHPFSFSSRPSFLGPGSPDPALFKQASPWRSRRGWSSGTERTGRRTRTRRHKGGRSRQRLGKGRQGERRLDAGSTARLLPHGELGASGKQALTVGHQAVVLILVQLNDGGVPAAVGSAEAAGGLCLPGGGEQGEEALIFGGGEGTAWSRSRGRVLRESRSQRQEQHCEGNSAGIQTDGRDAPPSGRLPKLVAGWGRPGGQCPLRRLRGCWGWRPGPGGHPSQRVSGVRGRPLTITLRKRLRSHFGDGFKDWRGAELRERGESLLPLSSVRMEPAAGCPMTRGDQSL